MKSEMKIEITLDSQEQLHVSNVNELLDEIISKLKDYKENGHYPFVDHIVMPEVLQETAAKIAKIVSLIP